MKAKYFFGASVLQVFEGLPRSLHFILKSSSYFTELQSQKLLIVDIRLKYSISSFRLNIKENYMSKISSIVQTEVDA